MRKGFVDSYCFCHCIEICIIFDIVQAMSECVHHIIDDFMMMIKAFISNYVEIQK